MGATHVADRPPLSRCPAHPTHLLCAPAVWCPALCATPCRRHQDQPAAAHGILSLRAQRAGRQALAARCICHLCLLRYAAVLLGWAAFPAHTYSACTHVRLPSCLLAIACDWVPPGIVRAAA